MDIQRQKQALYVILCDARSLMKRISARKSDYISIFALKRTREHFEHIFRSKYDLTTPDLLSYCPGEVIELYFRFHDHVEQLKWYLVHTDDMPNAVDEKITRDIHHIEETYNDFVTMIEGIIFEDDEALPPVPHKDPALDSILEMKGEDDDDLDMELIDE